MKIIRPIMLIIFALLPAGCASLPDTSSGNPEIVLTNVKLDCVQSLFMNGFMNQGYTVRNVSDTQIVAGKTANNAPYRYHTFYGGAPEQRITLLFFPMETPNVLQVVSTAAYVSNPTTATEKVYPIQGTLEDQEQLLSMQPMIEKRCGK
jgi:hypothetical protein